MFGFILKRGVERSGYNTVVFGKSVYGDGHTQKPKGLVRAYRGVKGRLGLFIWYVAAAMRHCAEVLLGEYKIPNAHWIFALCLVSSVNLAVWDGMHVG